MIPAKERKNFAEYLSRLLDEELPYDMAKQYIEDDWRINKPATIDIAAAAREFYTYSRTESYKNTVLATELLDDNFSVTESQLTRTLKSKYNFNDTQVKDVISNLHNSKAVDCHKNNFNGEIHLRKKSL